MTKIEIAYAVVTYLGPDEDYRSERGWVARSEADGGMFVVNWYDPSVPSNNTLDYYGCARVVKVDWQTPTVKVEAGAEPPSLRESKYDNVM